MATTFDVTNAVGVGDADAFVPEVWSMEILAAYKKRLVMANLVSKMNHKGKKGDTIHIPRPARGDASQKAEGNTVSLIAFTDTDKSVSINQHWEYSRLLEDITEVQAMASLRKFITDDAGYALAKRADTSLHGLGATLGGGTAYSTAVIGSNGSTVWSQAGSGNGAAIADAGIRRVIQTFDDNDVPGEDRYLVIPPVAKNTLLGLARFTEQAYTGEVGANNVIRNGRVGNVYGVEVYVSSNCPTVEANDSTAFRAAMMFQKDALVYVEQVAPRVQTQYKLEALGTLVVADALYGVSALRGDTSGDKGAGAQVIIVPA